MKGGSVISAAILLSALVSAVSPYAVASAQTSPVLYENSSVAGSQDVFYGSNWRGQTFTVGTSHTITSVKLPLLRMGSPGGSVVVGVRNVDASGNPTGADLASGSVTASSLIASWSPMTWYEFSLGSGCAVEAGKTYAIVWRAPSATSTNRTFYWANTAGTYSGGREFTSSNGGSSWSVASSGTWDAAFQEWGVAGSSPPPSSSGILSVRSTPSGATVALNGVSVGTTPLDTSVSSGAYSLSLSLNQYQGYSQSISVDSGQTTTVTATLVPLATSGGSRVMMKYLTAYGVSTSRWSTIVDRLAHFDIAAVDNPDMAALNPVVRQTYSHSNLKLLAYVDLPTQVQQQGYTNFNTSSSNYWGVYIVSLFNQWQSSTGGAFDGVFMDNAYVNAFGTPATYDDIFRLCDWLTGKLDGVRRIPIVLANAGSEELANHADIWMSECFADGNTGWKGTVVSQINDVAAITSAGRSVVCESRTFPNTEDYCRYALGCFLMGVHGTNYFAFSDIWGNANPAGSALGWYSLMDVDYGTPLGEYTRIGNVLTREFTRSTVTVNLDAVTAQMVMKGSPPPSNRQPSLNAIGSKSVIAGQALQFTVTASDPDGDAITYSASNLPAGASFNSASHVFNWTPTSSQVGTYAAVRFTVSDGSLSVYEDISITVASGNSAPVLGAIGNKTARPGQALQFTVTASDPNGDSLTYSASNLPAGASFNSASRAFSWTATASQAGTYTGVRFTVSDGSLSDYEDISITVTSGNTAPVLGAIGDRTARPGQALQFTVTASDSEGDALTYSAANLPAGASFNSASHVFNWSPTAGQIGTYAGVRFSVSDGSLSDYEDINIVVYTGNKGPLISPIGNKSVIAGQTLQFTVEASDPDGDPIVLSASDLPSGASFDATTRKFSWTPNASQSGTYNGLVFRVSDGSLTGEETITVTVSAGAPVATGGGVSASLSVSRNILDVSPPVVSGLSISSVSKNSVAVAWTTDEASTGSVECRGTDGVFSSSNDTFAVEHASRIDGLSPLTTYSLVVVSRDQVGNLGRSEELSFTTSGNPPAMVVDNLDVTPKQIVSGQQATATVRVRNSGDISGNFTLILNTTSGTMRRTNSTIVTLEAGSSQDITFSISGESPGAYSLQVEQLSAALTVAQPATAVDNAGTSPAKISLMAVSAKGDQPGPNSPVAISYVAEGMPATQGAVRLHVAVARGGSVLDNIWIPVQLKAGAQPEEIGCSYTPAGGWQSGSYTVSGEILAGDRVIAIAPSRQFEVVGNPGVIRLSTLGWIISLALAIICATAALILSRRKAMMARWSPTGSSDSAA